MEHSRLFSKRTVAAWAAGSFAAAAVLAGCGIAIQRELTLKPSEVIYDDACGLQEYFDALKSPLLEPPAETFAQDLSMGNGKGGKTRFMFTGAFQMHYLNKVLRQNWTKLPPELLAAEAVEVEIKWTERAGVKRVVTTDDATLMANQKSWFLPYHICLSDLLFGEPLYDTRRVFLQLPPAGPSRFAPGVAGTDAGIMTPALARAAIVGTNGMVDAGVNRDNPDAGQPPTANFKRTTRSIVPAPLSYPIR